MPQVNLNDLEYYLLPSTTPPLEHLEIHDKAYAFWKSLWLGVFEQLRFDASGLDQDFTRQDVIACITHAGEPIGMHLYTFFAIGSAAARAHPYMTANYPEIFFAKLKQMGVRYAMSMEYMTVHPDWRKKSCEVHIGSVLGGLAIRVMEQYGMEAAIAPARRDHKVNEIAYSFGGDCVVANVMNHNVACDLVAFVRGRTHPHESEKIREAEDLLWGKRKTLVDIKEYNNVIPLPRRERKAA